MKTTKKIDKHHLSTDIVERIIATFDKVIKVLPHQDEESSTSVHVLTCGGFTTIASAAMFSERVPEKTDWSSASP